MNFNFGCFVLSIYGIIITILVIIVMIPFFIGKVLYSVFVSILPKFSNMPKWCEKWSDTLTKFYDKFLVKIIAMIYLLP